MLYQDLIEACHGEWQDYTSHEFVQKLANGSLHSSCFLHYLKQDFLFLKQYARAYALAIYKAQSLEDMRQALPHVQALLIHELSHHIQYCEQWGISEQEMEAETEDFGTVAYTRYVLDTGMSGDLLDLYAALAPCAIGYAIIGKRLINEPSTIIEGNPFASWVQLYSGEEFQNGVQQSANYINSLFDEIDIDSPRGQRLTAIFRTATRMEIAFWQQGLNVSQENL